jgi:uncharacterized membrane protein
MNETIALSIDLHLLFIYLSIGNFVLFYLFNQRKNIERVRFFSLQQTLFLSALFFTGLIVMAMAKFDVSVTVWAMIPLWLLLIVLQAKRAVFLKRIVKHNADPEPVFETFARSIPRDFLLLVAITLLFTLL